LVAAKRDVSDVTSVLQIEIIEMRTSSL
jgi:hypothetical protein